VCATAEICVQAGSALKGKVCFEMPKALLLGGLRKVELYCNILLSIFGETC